MDQILQNYQNRFANNQKSIIQPNKFFTQFDLSEYLENLPYLFDIENFCLRLLKARLNYEKICIFSDYDTDAVTATATMLQGLTDLGFKQEKLDFYSPDRFIEGYGMNVEAIKKLSQDFDLIISVDCGINSVSEAEFLQDQKCDLMITDHHHLTEKLPPAWSVVNPRLAEEYLQNQGKTDFKSFPKIKTEILKSLLLSNQQKKILEIWIKKIQNLRQEISLDKCLTSSVTGVGVVWFGLVWFGYFWSELSEE